MPAPPSDWRPLLGRKVSIRYRLHGDEYPFSEAIGVLQKVDETPDGRARLEILTTRGDVVTVMSADVLAAKIFPARRL